jgi:sulfhydrogenase subunit beta (sulfur reductase)
VRTEGTRMEARILQPDRLCDLTDALLEEYAVIGPVDDLSYGEINSSAELALGDGKPRQSLKEFFFPDREVLFQYRSSENAIELTPPPVLDRARVIVGSRPCDAASLPILDKLFAWDYLDRSYLERRQNTTIISLACEEPCRACFCVSVGGSPADIEGSDLLLTPLGDVYHVLVVTQRGGALVEKYAQFFEASSKVHNRARARVEDQCRDKIVKQLDTEALRHALQFDSPAWEALTLQCIDCAVCTFLCPTCHCFDIQDEGGVDQGSRVRLWDSCARHDFTEMAAHQPRPTHFRRYRQRLMHKFKYYPENFGRVLCVGCGRCIEYCPVGVDITEALKVAAG